MTARRALAPLATALLAAFAAFPAVGGAAGAGPARLFPYNASFWELVDEKGAVHDLPVAPLTGAISDGRWFVAPGRHGNAEAMLDGKKYVFKNGFLAAIEESGKKRTFEVPPAMPSGGVEALFPAEKSAAGEAQDGGGGRFSTKIWETSDRFNAFYGNPNKTAVLFVQLALVLLAAAIALPRRGSAARIAGAAVCAAGAAGCAACMFATQSRGGFVALAAGVAILATRFLRFTPRRIAIAAAALALAGCALWFAPGSERWTKNLFKVDESNSLRVNIMKAFPRMLHDAPEGWGAGNSGAAYVMWYRPDGEMHLVRALVSTHFTWLAEAGWPGRFAYIAGWLVWLAAAARLFRRGGGWFRTAALPLAAATLVAMAFNHAGEEWTLWAVPAAAMAAAVAGRRGREVLFNGRFRRNAAWCCAIVALAAGTCAALCLAGRPSPGEPQILKDGPLVRVCGAATARVPREKRKTVCIAMDEAATGGWMFAGKELLDYCLGAEDAPEAVLTDESLAGLPEEAERLVLTGRACREYLRRAKAGEPVAKAQALVFLSPACDIAEIPERLAQSEGFRAVAGSLAAARMKDAAGTRPWLRIVKGAELYIPGWHRIALAR